MIFNKLLPLGLKGLWSLTWKAAFLNGALLELVWLSRIWDVDFNMGELYEKTKRINVHA